MSRLHVKLPALPRTPRSVSNRLRPTEQTTLSSTTPHTPSTPKNNKYSSWVEALDRRLRRLETVDQTGDKQTLKFKEPNSKHVGVHSSVTTNTRGRSCAKSTSRLAINNSKDNKTNNKLNTENISLAVGEAFNDKTVNKTTCAESRRQSNDNRAKYAAGKSTSNDRTAGLKGGIQPSNNWTEKCVGSRSRSYDSKSMDAEHITDFKESRARKAASAIRSNDLNENCQESNPNDRKTFFVENPAKRRLSPIATTPNDITCDIDKRRILRNSGTLSTTNNALNAEDLIAFATPARGGKHLAIKHPPPPRSSTTVCENILPVHVQKLLHSRDDHLSDDPNFCSPYKRGLGSLVISKPLRRDAPRIRAPSQFFPRQPQLSMKSMDAIDLPILSVSMPERIRFEGLTADPDWTPSWVVYRQGRTIDEIRFQLPMDMKELEGMTPLGYLNKFTRLRVTMKRTFTNIFYQFTSHKNPDFISYESIYPALNMLFADFLGKHNYRTLKSLILDLEDYSKHEISLQEFFGLSAFCERRFWSMYFDYSNTTGKKQEPKLTTDISDIIGKRATNYVRCPILEYIDFGNLNSKLTGVNISPELRLLLTSLV